MKPRSFRIWGVLLLVGGLLTFIQPWGGTSRVDLSILILCVIGFLTCFFFSDALDYLAKIRNSNKKMREMMESHFEASSDKKETAEQQSTEQTED